MAGRGDFMNSTYEPRICPSMLLLKQSPSNIDRIYIRRVVLLLKTTYLLILITLSLIHTQASPIVSCSASAPLHLHNGELQEPRFRRDCPLRARQRRPYYCQG